MAETEPNQSHAKWTAPEKQPAAPDVRDLRREITAEEWNQSQRDRIQKLEEERVQLREQRPYPEIPVHNLQQAIDINPQEAFSFFFSFVKKLREDKEFQPLRDLGISFYNYKTSDIGTDGVLFCSPFPTVRTNSPEGHQGNEAGWFGNDGKVYVWSDRVRRSSWDLSLKDALLESMTQEDQVVSHETIHGFQNINPNHERWYKEDALYRGLNEAEAWISQDFFQPRGKNDQGTEQIVKILESDSYNIPTDQARYAMSVVKRLTAIGLNEKDMAHFVGSELPYWDDKESISPAIENRIADAMRDKGVPEKADLELGWQAHCLERGNLGRKMANLVREGLGKIFSENRQKKNHAQTT